MNIEEIKKLKLIHYCKNCDNETWPQRNEFTKYSTNCGTQDRGMTFMCINCGAVVSVLETEEEERYTLDEFKKMFLKMKEK